MKRRLLAVFMGLAIIVAFGACKKEAEEQKAQSPHVPPAGPGVMMPKGETQIVVPDNVKGRWNAVVLTLEDRGKNTKEDLTIKLGESYAIPDSAVTISVGDFLPDFRMDGLTITSASDLPNNPAVQVTVNDGDKEVFKGWLYSKFPTIHPFQHEKYGLTLKEGVGDGKKGS